MPYRNGCLLYVGLFSTNSLKLKVGMKTMNDKREGKSTS